jgi:hypothetical protein
MTPCLGSFEFLPATGADGGEGSENSPVAKSNRWEPITFETI